MSRGQVAHAADSPSTRRNTHTPGAAATPASSESWTYRPSDINVWIGVANRLRNGSGGSGAGSFIVARILRVVPWRRGGDSTAGGRGGGAAPGHVRDGEGAGARRPRRGAPEGGGARL